MGENKKSLHKQFIVVGVLRNDTTKIYDAFCNYSIDHTRNIHGYIPISTSHLSDQVEINEKSMYLQNATETDIIESITHLNKEGGINDVSRIFLVMCKNYISCYLKQLFNPCIKIRDGDRYR